MISPRIVPIDPRHPDPALLAEAGALLRAGGLVAFPTETVYGLGADALNPEAVARIYSAKGRPAFNPVIVHVASSADARNLVTRWPDAADQLAAAFWPGPLTLVLPRAETVPDIVTAGGPAVALRLPAHPVARALIAAAGVPIAAPSANRSSGISPTTADHVARSLGDRVDLILDGGPTGVGIESTVVDLTGDTPRVLRPGPISALDLEAVVGPLADTTPRDDDGPLLSPGRLDRHYAPAARVLLFGADQQSSVADTVQHARREGAVIGGMLLTVELPGEHMLRMPSDPADYARALYATLHQLDHLRCTLVAIEMVPPALVWGGVRDRLIRAATPER